MELPHLGQNCALKQCNQLDFLPVKCDACAGIFCLQHYQYDTHNCDKARNRNVQVPVCPLCSEPVVSRRGELPDVAVSQHIDQYCKRNDSIKGRLQKPKTNLQACNYKSCKQKDVIYLECADCRLKFCVKHRHPSDHLCPGPSTSANIANNWQSFRGSCATSATSGYEMIKQKANQISKSGQAALNRLAATGSHMRPGSSHGASSSRSAAVVSVDSLQGNLSESEAMAIAINESKSNNKQMTFQSEDEDMALARALHESQMEANRNRAPGKDSCVLS